MIFGNGVNRDKNITNQNEFNLLQTVIYDEKKQLLPYYTDTWMRKNISWINC